MDMFALKFDDKMRAARAKGIEYRKIATLYENTPEFEAMWAAYVENDDVLYNILTEDDGRTHTFYRIYLPTEKADNDDAVSVTKEVAHAEAAG